MNPGLSLDPVPAEKRRASVLDVALVFAGANVVSTTLVTGGTLAAGGVLSLPRLAVTIALGLLLGTVPVALLARLGPRYGLPSMVLLRDVFGVVGAALVSLLLLVTNFAWIALNNVIAAEALEALVGGPTTGWSLLVGALAIAVAVVGPRAMILFDRFAVPLLALLGLLLTVRLLAIGAPPPSSGAGMSGALPLLAAVDVVAAYQLSWSLMFADYTRFQRRAGSASLAVLAGLGLSSAWLMTIGARAAQFGGSNDPTAMVLGLGLPVPVLAVVVLSTVTTNFVNLYLSSLAVRNLWPRAPALPTVLAVGAVGTALGLLSPDLLQSYAGFMALLATVLLPIVAIGLVHFLRPRDPLRPPRLRPLALGCWAAGAVGYLLLAQLLPAGGATLPTLIGTAVLYALLERAVTPSSELARRSEPCRG